MSSKSDASVCCPMEDGPQHTPASFDLVEINGTVKPVTEKDDKIHRILIHVVVTDDGKEFIPYYIDLSHNDLVGITRLIPVLLHLIFDYASDRRIYHGNYISDEEFALANYNDGCKVCRLPVKPMLILNAHTGGFGSHNYLQCCKPCSVRYNVHYCSVSDCKCIFDIKDASSQSSAETTVPSKKHSKKDSEPMEGDDVVKKNPIENLTQKAAEEKIFGWHVRQEVRVNMKPGTSTTITCNDCKAALVRTYKCRNCTRQSVVSWDADYDNQCFACYTDWSKSKFRCGGLNLTTQSTTNKYGCGKEFPVSEKHNDKDGSNAICKSCHTLEEEDKYLCSDKLYGCGKVFSLEHHPPVYHQSYSWCQACSKANTEVLKYSCPKCKKLYCVRDKINMDALFGGQCSTCC